MMLRVIGFVRTWPRHNPIRRTFFLKIYRFLTCDDASEVCHKVTKALSNGWELAGCPSYSHDATVGVMHCGPAKIKDVRDTYQPIMNLGAY